MTNREAPINQILTTSSHTVNYDLPLWEGQDITSWLTTMNDAMDKIDTAIYGRQTDIGEIYKSIAEALEKANAASEAAQNATEAVPQLQTDMRTVKAQVLLNTQNITKNAQAIANLGTENGSINLSLTQIQNDISETNNKITQISGSMAILQEKVDAIPDNVTGLAGQVQTNTEDIEGLKEEDTNIKASIEQLQNHLTTVDGEVAQNITDIAASKQWQTQTGQTIDNLTEALTELQQSLASVKFAIVTQEQYDSLSPKDSNTLYFIKEETT